MVLRPSKQFTVTLKGVTGGKKKKNSKWVVQGGKTKLITQPQKKKKVRGGKYKTRVNLYRMTKEHREYVTPTTADAAADWRRKELKDIAFERKSSSRSPSTIKDTPERSPMRQMPRRLSAESQRAYDKSEKSPPATPLRCSLRSPSSPSPSSFRTNPQFPQGGNHPYSSSSSGSSCDSQGTPPATLNFFESPGMWGKFSHLFPGMIRTPPSSATSGVGSGSFSPFSSLSPSELVVSPKQRQLLLKSPTPVSSDDSEYIDDPKLRALLGLPPKPKDGKKRLDKFVCKKRK